jgi:ketosteroid isomerase-like protein
MKMSFVTRAFISVSALSLIVPATLCAQQTDRPPTLDAARATQDSLLAQRERAQWEALKARDTTTFARLMGGDLVDIDLSGIKRTSPASTARYVLGCQTMSYALSDVRVAHFGATAIVTYKTTVDATCWGQKAPSPLYVMTVYSQRGDTWLPVAHSETPAAHW